MSAPLAHYTVAQARYVLSHVYCVHHVPDDDGSVYEWRPGAGERECCRCHAHDTRDLRLHLVSVRRAEEWLVTENAAIDRFNAERGAAAGP